ncbi:MAG: phosphoenolpyruvate--protein phosphotransferase, partial [Candidatus Omnitrophica bacterium]|nr:phosphoenolpyruvate--protein phosphotransferase [Candidatus Omnitrophota bacterium]
FSQQIKAILRAGKNANVGIMFPMISSVDEFMAAKRVVEDCMSELKDKNIAYNTKPKIGLMIELPSVMEVIEELAELADFFSIGTNDFIQYMLAVDRTNEKVADLYLPHHPSILRGLKRVVDAAKRHKTDVSVCGDMAHETKFMPYLLGIGIRKLSLNANFIPRIQKVINRMTIKDAERQTKNILSKSRLREIVELLE